MEETAFQDFMEEINWWFHPEPDEDGFRPREFPNKRIRELYKLDLAYMESLDWEGSTMHEHTRLFPAAEERMHVIIKNQDVPDRLFVTALRLFADSIIEYHNKNEKEGELRFYPPIILTFWAGFETFIRHSSELLIVTAEKLPTEVKNFLSEEENFIDQKGEIANRTRFYSLLDRYAVFLKYAYHFNVNKGDLYWQNLVKAKKLRDYYTHLDVSEPRKVTSTEMLLFMEAILLSIIIPSSKLKRTLMLGVYWLYDIWTILHKYNVEYAERPFFYDWPLKEDYMFHCNFENVDHNRFPTSREHFDKIIANKTKENKVEGSI
jgi:hypothetical protein